MKQVFCFLFLYIIAQTHATAQISITTDGSAPHPSAMLEVKSTNKGFLPPRMTTSQRLAISSPAIGLVVYDTDTKLLYHYDGIAWRYILNSTLWNYSTTRNAVYNFSDSIGIGTSIPTQKLDVNGNIRSRGRVDADGVIEGAGLSSSGVLYVNSTSLLAGTVTGSAGANFYGPITTNGGFTIKDDAGTLALQTGGNVDKGFVQLSGDNLRIGTYSTNTAGRLIMRLNGADRIFVENDGKMGIGVDGADAKLHINSGASIETLRLTGNTNTILRFMTGTTEKADIYSASNHLSLTTAQPGGQVRLNNEVYVDADANKVGIGTSIPEERLHVAGNVKVNGGKVLSNDNYNMIPIAWAAFSSSGNKINGTPNISAVAVTSGDYRYFKVTVSGVNLSYAVAIVTPRFPASLISSATPQDDGSLWVHIKDGTLYDHTPFNIVIYN